MTNKKPNCLIICSASEHGVSAQSFIHSFTLTHSAFNVFIVTPQGRPIEFSKVDDNSLRWLNEFKSKPFSIPGKLEDVDIYRYSAVLIPSGTGCLFDLAANEDLGKLLSITVDGTIPLCAVGFGVGALASAVNENIWKFEEYSLTGPSVFEMASNSNFSELPIIVEDHIKENGASYSASQPNSNHVVIDRHVITGQNEMSTLTAVQNLILLCNAKQGKR